MPPWTSHSDKGLPVYIFRTEITIINGISSAMLTAACGLVLAGDGTVADLKFLDDEVLLVLWTWVSKGNNIDNPDTRPKLKPPDRT